MTAVATAYDSTHTNYIMFRNLIRATKIKNCSPRTAQGFGDAALASPASRPGFVEVEKGVCSPKVRLREIGPVVYRWHVSHHGEDEEDNEDFP